MVTSLPVMLMENCLRESRLSLIRHCSRPIGDVPMVKECSIRRQLPSLRVVREDFEGGHICGARGL